MGLFMSARQMRCTRPAIILSLKHKWLTAICSRQSHLYASSE